MTIKRQTADRYIPLVCERARSINAGPYAYQIERIEVFGSYLTDKEMLGDLDLMVTKRVRHADADQQERLCEERRGIAIAGGRTFPLFLYQLYWPEEEVDRLLKGGNRGISIHHADERSELLKMGAMFQVVYEA